MKCNIDTRGRVVRLATGMVEVLAALVLLGIAATGLIPARWPWGMGAILLIGGGFQIFESWAGWCVIRAMGFKTKI